MKFLVLIPITNIFRQQYQSVAIVALSSMDNLKWYNKAAEMNSHQNTNTDANNDMIDLTLKIGLPFPTFHNNQQGLVNEGAMNIEGEQKFNGDQYAWASDQMGNNSTVHNMNYGNDNSTVHNMNYGNDNSTVHNMNYGNVFPSIGYPSYNTTNSYNNFSPTLDPPSGYTLLDVPPRRAAANQRQRELGGSSVFGMGGQGQRIQRFGTYNDPNKRCTNYNCNTNDTPMWRKGPLGPKTLCNACGIKYRKEKEKRMERKAEAEAEVEAYRPIMMDE